MRRFITAVILVSLIAHSLFRAQSGALTDARTPIDAQVAGVTFADQDLPTALPAKLTGLLPATPSVVFVAAIGSLLLGLGASHTLDLRTAISRIAPTPRRRRSFLQVYLN